MTEEGGRKEREERRRAQKERRASQGHGAGVEVKGEEWEVEVPEGGDGEGDEDGDEVLEHAPSPPHNPLLYPSPSGSKRPMGKIQGCAIRQPLPPGLPRSLNSAVRQTC